MMLLSSRQKMHGSFTQDAPPMTEDMPEKRLQAVAAFGNSSSVSAQLEREILLSDFIHKRKRQSPQCNNCKKLGREEKDCWHNAQGFSLLGGVATTSAAR